MQDVCFRHLADIPIVQQTPAFGGKRTWLSHRNMSARDPRGQRASLGQKYSLFLRWTYLAANLCGRFCTAAFRNLDRLGA